MAVRPVFIPMRSEPYFLQQDISFTWYPGQALCQAQRRIRSLHAAAALCGIEEVLEISSKSEQPLGEELSAFRLLVRTAEGCEITVECAYQGSKVYEDGGPFTDLYEATSAKAKSDRRHRTSGRLVRYNFMGHDFELEPSDAFYNRLYLSALRQSDAAERLLDYKAFTDIVFTPGRSLNCQARAAAVFVGMHQAKHLDRIPAL